MSQSNVQMSIRKLFVNLSKLSNAKYHKYVCMYVCTYVCIYVCLCRQVSKN